MSRLWDKGQGVDDLVLRFTVGNDHELDERLVSHDVRASQAHARMLHSCGHLKAEEAEQLVRELGRLGEEHAAGAWHIALAEEDVHTALEVRLTERLGELGGRLHLGRSRNDQVLAALRLWLLEASTAFAEEAGALAGELEALAARQGDVVLPGYTHLQRAMPSSVGDWAGAYASEIRDDAQGLLQAQRRASKNPLGSAAGYGTPGLELDREHTRAALGFAEVHEPVTAVQLSRGKAESALAFELVLLGQDLGRLAADLCLFASAEFGFVRLPTAFTTGSSIMPQKRNPDVFELVRARTAQMPAELSSILALTQKMSSGYHRDLQLVKRPLFRLADEMAETLEVLRRAVAAVAFVEERCQAAMDPSLFATAEAYDMVQREGIPFREAYRRVGARFAQDPSEASPRGRDAPEGEA